MKTSTYINDLLQASLFPAIIFWAGIIILTVVINRLIFFLKIKVLAFHLEDLGFLFIGITFIIAYAFACYGMHVTYGEKYRNP